MVYTALIHLTLGTVSGPSLELERREISQKGTTISPQRTAPQE